MLFQESPIRRPPSRLTRERSGGNTAEAERIDRPSARVDKHGTFVNENRWASQPARDRVCSECGALAEVRRHSMIGTHEAQDGGVRITKEWCPQLDSRHRCKLHTPPHHNQRRKDLSLPPMWTIGWSQSWGLEGGLRHDFWGDAELEVNGKSQ